MKITNKYNLPEAYFRACQRDEHPRFDMSTFSVTEILKGNKEILLNRRHYAEMEVDCSDMTFMILGRAVHYVFEGKESDDELSEQRVSLDFLVLDKTITLSGGFDLYNDNLKKLTDYKTTKIFSYLMKMKEGYDSDWYKQLELYWFLLNSQGFPVTNAEILIIFTDWSKSKARIDRDYPNYGGATVKYDISGSSNALLVEKKIINKLTDILSDDRLEDDAIPPCSKKQRWERDEKWALMKSGRKSAVKLYDNEMDAAEACDVSGNGYSVVHRPGTPTKCLDYCSCNKYCSFYKDYMKNLESD